MEPAKAGGRWLELLSPWFRCSSNPWTNGDGHPLCGRPIRCPKMEAAFVLKAVMRPPQDADKQKRGGDHQDGRKGEAGDDEGAHKGMVRAYASSVSGSSRRLAKTSHKLSSAPLSPVSASENFAGTMHEFLHVLTATFGPKPWQALGGDRWRAAGVLIGRPSAGADRNPPHGRSRPRGVGWGVATKRNSSKSKTAAVSASRAADKEQHLPDRRNAPALRGSDWPTNDLLEAKPSAASRKRSRTAEARADRHSH